MLGRQLPEPRLITESSWRIPACLLTSLLPWFFAPTLGTIGSTALPFLLPPALDSVVL
jgi:hypothetical protein